MTPVLHKSDASVKMHHHRHMVTLWLSFPKMVVVTTACIHGLQQLGSQSIDMNSLMPYNLKMM
jgi:hypothetical protein